jgi:SagB-type dehydrogenase family enzyme
VRNYEVEATWHYHNGTKHPHGMLLGRFHVYHPSQRPTPYKIYKNVPVVNLPVEKNSLGVPTIDAVCTKIDIKDKTIPDLETLSRILYFSAGITKKIKFPGLGEMDFRAASCTGALYHIEIYVVCSDIPGLDAGVYHFDPKETNLEIIRHGDYREKILSSTANESFTKNAPIMLIFTDVFARNSVKYQAREYRHAFWDSGTILANTLAITTSHKIPSKIITGFVDSQIGQLLGLDTIHEVPLVILPLGITDQEIPPSPDVTDLNLESISSEYDIEYPEINAVYDSACLLNESEVKTWRHEMVPESKIHNPQLIPLEKRTDSDEPIENTIIKRGSTRKFSLESITLEQLSTILTCATSGIDADFVKHGTLSDLYIIVNAVDGLDSGSYYYVREKNSLELLRKGNFRNTSGNLGLNQDLPYDASVTIFFMADLKKILEQFGNRGYRIAQLDASIGGGKAYLASYALGLGATGLTFYDDAVTSFFSPHAVDKETMFLIAIGKKEKSRNQTSS